MASDITNLPEYRDTIAQLESVKKTGFEGVEYWMARDIQFLMGYPNWREFEVVIGRATDSIRTNGIDPSHHFEVTHKMVGLGSGSQRPVTDYFLSRPAAYLIAMNGDPAKPQIAAAQAYFVVQTRIREMEDERSDDEKRLELREKVSQSAKIVSGVAQDAGVRSKMQGIFHDQRYQGLYGMSLKDLKGFKGLKDKDALLDRAGLLELSMHDFQMNLASDVIGKDPIKNEARAIRSNLDVAKRVRKTVLESEGTSPENLLLEPPIKDVKKRVEGQKKIAG